MQYIIYFILIICGLIFVKNRFVSVVLLVFDMILIGFIHGGADYQNYELIYERANINYNFGTGVEIGFQFLCVFCRDVLHFNFEMFYIVIGIVPLLLIYSTVRRYTENSAMVMALFSIFPLLICIIQIRSLLSFSIVFWGIRYLEDKKVNNLIKYGVCVCIAMTIHASSIFFLVVYLVLIKDNEKLFKVVFVCCVVSRFLILPIGMQIMRSYPRYAHFILSCSVLTQICALGILVINFIFAWRICSCVNIYEARHMGVTISEFNVRSIRYARLALKISIIAFLAWPFFALTMEAMRFLRYLVIFNYILYSIPARTHIKVQMQYLIRLGSCVMACFFLWYFCMKGIYWNSVFLPIFEKNQIFDFFIS